MCQKIVIRIFRLIAFVLLYSNISLAQLPPLLARQEFLTAFTRNEQVVNDKVENTDIFATIMDATIPILYRPEAQKVFPLYAYNVPLSDVVVINTQKSFPSSIIFPESNAANAQTIRFFVHPVSIEAFKPYVKDYALDGNFLATPLSSYRAILAWEDREISFEASEVFNLKVSLDAEIGQTRRMLSRGQIERAAVMSLALKEANLDELEKQGIVFIDEPFHVYLKKFEFGYSWRSIPKLEVGAELLPMFSLYSLKGKSKSKLQELIEFSGMETRDYLKQFIIEPLVRQMFFLGFTEGVVSEPHEQNVLIELKNGRLSGRFFYRDLAGFHFSPELRAAAGKSLDFVPQSFNPESLKTERANILRNMRSYLIESNFFAMRAAVKSPFVTKDWVEETVFNIVKEEVQKRTGYQVNEWAKAEKAIADYSRQTKTPRMCSLVLAY